MPAGRTRRAAAKAIDYSKEQEFSDAEDLFEDEPPEPSTDKKRGRPRKNKFVDTDDDDDGTFKAEKPVYTEKGYDSSLPPLRERFPFLPEYEDDGSPKIEQIVGRRPIDEKEDAAAEDSDNDEAGPEDSPKARKTRGGTSKDSSPAKAKGDGQVVEYEYLIKYRGRSYLHLEWKRGADLESMNKSAKGIYRRFLKKIEAGLDEDIENPEFDPMYLVPEKIIDEADQEITVELSDKELIKWEKEREKEIEAEKKANGDDHSEKKDKSKSPQKASQVDKEEKKDEEVDGMSRSCLNVYLIMIPQKRLHGQMKLILKPWTLNSYERFSRKKDTSIHTSKVVTTHIAMDMQRSRRRSHELLTYSSNAQCVSTL